MPIFDRKKLISIHIIIAGLIFPVLVMFAFTGALYTWGIKGGYDHQNYDVIIESPLTANKNSLLAIANKKLTDLDIARPTGKAKIKKMNDSFQLQWSGSNRNVILQATNKPLLARMTVENTHAYRVLVQLHKAKGGIAFKIYAAALSTALFLLLISGFIMAWKMPKYRQLVTTSVFIGAAIFIVMLIIS